jgi:hypothetical protein
MVLAPLWKMWSVDVRRQHLLTSRTELSASNVDASSFQSSSPPATPLPGRPRLSHAIFLPQDAIRLKRQKCAAIRIAALPNGDRLVIACEVSHIDGMSAQMLEGHADREFCILMGTQSSRGLFRQMRVDNANASTCIRARNSVSSE